MIVAVDRQIDAPPERVFAILTDANRLTSGGFGIVSLTGAIALGKSLRLVSSLAPKRTFRLKVIAFDPPRAMVWRGGTPVVFTGTRTFTLTPAGGGTHFQMTERFTGLFAGPIAKAMPNLNPSFETFADALKHHAENAQ